MLENRECPLEAGASLVSAFAPRAFSLRTHTPEQLASLGMYVQSRHFMSAFRLFAHDSIRSLKSRLSCRVSRLSPSWRPRHRLSARRLIRRFARDSPLARSTQCRSTAQVQVAQRALPAVVALPAWRSVLALERFCALQQDAASGGALVRVPPFPSTAVWFAARSLALLPRAGGAPSGRAPLAARSAGLCADAPHLVASVVAQSWLRVTTTQFGYRMSLARRGVAGDATRSTLQFARAADGAHDDCAMWLVVGVARRVLHAPAGMSLLMDALVDCLSAMLADAAVGGGGDLCVLSAEGCGKSVMCAWLAQALGYGADEVVHVDLFKEVSTRDLFMRRDTSDSRRHRVADAATGACRAARPPGAARRRAPPASGRARGADRAAARSAAGALTTARAFCAQQAYDAMQFREALTDAQMLARGWRRAHEAFRVVLCGNDGVVARRGARRCALVAHRGSHCRPCAATCCPS
jgi:hypothetical protein